MPSQPWIECRKGHGKEGVRGYIWCSHITMAFKSGKQTSDEIRANVGYIRAPTTTSYGLILCSSSKAHEPYEKLEHWNLVCEKCLAERGWIKLESEQAPMVTLASELPRDLDFRKEGLKRKPN